MMSDNNDKQRLKKAYNHGKNVGGYLVSDLSERFAPLTFDSWYDQLIYQEQANDKKETTSNGLLCDAMPSFKKGDKITLNTGYICDTGIFIKYDGELIEWESIAGGTHVSNPSKYNIELLK